MLPAFQTPRLTLRQIVAHLDRHALIVILGMIVGLSAVLYGGWQLQDLGAVSEVPLAACNTEESVSASPSIVVVEVAGAVQKPGIYSLTSDQRTADALTAAGGLSSEAHSEYVAKQLSLAGKLQDGSTIYIPFAEEELGTVDASLASAVSADSTASSDHISINTASASQLQELEGIGEKRAADIIAARPYQSLTELVSKGVLSEGQYETVEKAISL